MRLLGYLRPFGVFTEVVPGFHTLVSVFEGDHVGQFVIALADISSPVTNVLDAVLFEQLHCVIGESGVDIGESSGQAFVDA